LAKKYLFIYRHSLWLYSTYDSAVFVDSNNVVAQV